MVSHSNASHLTRFKSICLIPSVMLPAHVHLDDAGLAAWLAVTLAGPLLDASAPGCVWPTQVSPAHATTQRMSWSAQAGLG